MNEPRPALPDSPACDRCEELCDPDDNFCRNCGLSLRVSENLPSVRERPLPAIRQPSVLPVTVARGAAFVAIGKLVEMGARHVARSVFSSDRGKNLPAGRRDAPADVFSETVVLRRIRIRR